MTLVEDEVKVIGIALVVVGVKVGVSSGVSVGGVNVGIVGVVGIVVVGNRGGGGGSGCGCYRQGAGRCPRRGGG